MSIHIKEVDRGWKGMLDALRVYKSQNVHVKVGFLDDGGKGSEDHGGLTTAELAGVHEFGTEDGHVPARSFVGSTFEANREKYHDDLKKLLAKVFTAELTMEQVFNIMGARMANDIKRAVTSGDGIPPPNAASTIAAKGSDRTLIDTARMIAAITWHVVMNGLKGAGLVGDDVPVKPPAPRERSTDQRKTERKKVRHERVDDAPMTLIEGKPHGRGSPVHYTPKGDEKPAKGEVSKKGRSQPSKTVAPKKGPEKLLTKAEADAELVSIGNIWGPGKH